MRIKNEKEIIISKKVYYDLEFNLTIQLKKDYQEINLTFLINISKHENIRDTKDILNILISQMSRVFH